MWRYLFDTATFFRLTFLTGNAMLCYQEVVALKIRNIVLCGLFAGLLCVCAWLGVSAGDFVFTMQTFAVFPTLLLLGGKRGSAAIGIYLLLGAVGLPVFSGFRGGLGWLLGATGGYLTGFLFTGLVYWLLHRLTGRQIPALLAGLFVLYLFGTCWYAHLYAQSGFWAIAAKCVLPYLAGDGIKLLLALALAKKLGRFVY